MRKPAVRKERKYVPLSRKEFRARFDARYFDPAFNGVRAELDRIFAIAWDGYIEGRKAPRTRAAGRGYADPGYKLSIEWSQTKAAITAAARRQHDAKSPSRILIINGSTRSEHSCPGEISKTRRLAEAAQRTIAGLSGFEVDVLDLSTLADEPLKAIYPCKACVSTAMPLCHWPCSCYPNHALGQTGDWMAEIYPRWVAAHGVFILCPVHWYQAPASLKLMMDRLVCADGGNPDPTTTQGKDPALAKQVELKGWHYPKHLAGRAFAVVAHGDAAGAEGLRRDLTDWLTDMELIQAGDKAAIDTWIGWYKPYATSHQELDKDPDVFADVRNAARSLASMVRQIRRGAFKAPDRGLRDPRQK